MPCRVEGDAAVYETARSPATALEMGRSDGVFIRALRQRDQKPYKRYVSPCKKQRDWAAVRARLRRLRDRAAEETERHVRRQAEYDARTLRTTLPPLVAALRAFRAVNNQAVFAPFADRIDALDDQGKVALAPWLARNACAKPRPRLKQPMGEALKRAKEDLDVVIDALEVYTTQFDFTRGEGDACPRLAIGADDERTDPIALEPFVPSQTVLVRVSDPDDARRHACLPYETIVEYANALHVVKDSGERRWREQTQDFEDGPGRGQRYVPVVHVFPYGNTQLMHAPLDAPALRLLRLQRP